MGIKKTMSAEVIKKQIENIDFKLNEIRKQEMPLIVRKIELRKKLKRL